MRDEMAMRRALALGDSARRVAPPWPWVGCVLVRDGVVLGEGATGRHPQGPHAEVAALSCVDDARGATAYVTLEPCDHHGNTPPCTEALVSAGVERVVVALRDPDLRVSGRGIARLREAGLGVEVGIGESEARTSLRPYLHHRETGRPFCVLKTATSLDGRIAAADGTSRWITGREARVDVHRMRSESQAIVVGANTALADRPALTVRDAPAPARPAVRVLLDAVGRVPPGGPLFDPELGPTLVMTTDASPGTAREAWSAAGADVVVLQGDETGLAPAGVLDHLGSIGALQVIVEGGAAVHGAFLSRGVVDQVVAYIAPLLLGREGRIGWGVGGPSSIDDAARWQLEDVCRMGDDVRVIAVPVEEVA